MNRSLRRRFPFVLVSAALVACASAAPDDGAAADPTGAAAAAAHGTGTAVASTSRTNVVLFLFDDLDDHATRRYFAEVMPTFTALERDGVRFRESFVPTAICCASRASTLTGRCGHNTNVLTNGGERGGWAQFRDEDGTAPGATPATVNAALAGAGYRTGLFGKYMNGYETTDAGNPPVPPGWTDWHAFIDPKIQSYTGYGYDLLEASNGAAPTVESHGRRPEDYATDVLRDKAVRFLADAHAAGKPAFLYFAATAPHLPLPAAPRHRAIAKKWSCETMPKGESRPNYFADGASFADKPLWLRATQQKRGSDAMKAYNCADWSDRLGSLYAADEALAAIVAQLRASGEWDRTLLVVTSDNGYNLGAHSLVHKMAPYEESIRVPLFVTGGAALGLRHGAVDGRGVLNIDLAPTFREVAGLAPDPAIDGRSILALARGAAPAAPWRTRMPLEYAGGAAANGIGAEVPAGLQYAGLPAPLLDIPPYRGLRTLPEDAGEHAWKLVEWYAHPEHPSAHEYELYDVTADPFELENLAVTQPARASLVKRALLPQLEALSACKGAGCSSR